jgi:hypothetical protein
MMPAAIDLNFTFHQNQSKRYVCTVENLDTESRVFALVGMCMNVLKSRSSVCSSHQMLHNFRVFRKHISGFLLSIVVRGQWKYFRHGGVKILINSCVNPFLNPDSKLFSRNATVCVAMLDMFLMTRQSRAQSYRFRDAWSCPTLSSRSLPRRAMYKIRKLQEPTGFSLI